MSSWQINDDDTAVLLLQSQNPTWQLVAEAATSPAYPCQARECLRGREHRCRRSRCRRRCQPRCLNGLHVAVTTICCYWHCSKCIIQLIPNTVLLVIILSGLPALRNQK